MCALQIDHHVDHPANEIGTASFMIKNTRSGGQILVDQLRINDVKRVYSVPGESYLAVLDAFVDVPEINVVTCRQEGGAAMMAEAEGKLTGRPGICFVTRGPGATNASGGVHIGFQDSTPMILFIGQVARGMAEREAFQEIDFRHMFGPMAKWVAQIDDPARIPEMVSRAFHVASSGRPGPVVLALPEDMLTEQCDAPDAKPYVAVQPAPAPAHMEQFHDLLMASSRPLAVIGGGDWSRQSAEQFQDFASRFDLPVAASFRSQSHFDNRLDQYVGQVGIGVDPELVKALNETDLLIVFGARLGEMTSSGYNLFDIPTPKQPMVHIYPDPEELGRVYHPTLAINSGAAHFTDALGKLESPKSIPWAGWRERLRTAYEASTSILPHPGDVQMGEVVSWLRDRIPDDAIIANGAGNYTGWITRNYRFHGYRTLIGPTSGTMGYGTPGAIACKLARPETMVVNVSGDGCFMMHGQEMATAVQYGANIITIIVNNGMYGTIRMHQEREYPTRISATPLRNPDFVALAEAYGAHGELVTTTEEFAPAFERCVAADKPSLIEVQVSPEAITAVRTLSEIREAALARQ